MSPATALQQPAASVEPDRRRWVALGFIALAQLMIALDATVVSIALPSAQGALRFSDADRQWVVTAYTLAFGALLLLGGRIADQLGSKRALLLGLGGFAVASMAGGAAPALGVLVAARAVQGAFAALLAPTALALLATTFTEPRERATAFSVYGSIAGSGAALGMLLGGALTQYLSWRWCLFVNLPIAGVAAAGGSWVLPRSKGGGRPALDLPGAILAGGALAALAYGCSVSVTDGWSSTVVIASVVSSAALLVLFVVREATARQPLIPLGLLAERNRAGAYFTVGLATAGMFGAFLFLTYFLQVVLRYSPLVAGAAFLPITIASQAGSWLVARRLLPRVGPRALMTAGAAIAAGGLALLTQLHTSSSYVQVLPAEVLLGLGISTAMVPAFSTATHGVDRRQAGVASAVVNASGQVGAALGTAVLNTIAAASALGLASSRAAALVHGFSTAAVAATGIMALAALAALVLISAGPPPLLPNHALDAE